MPKQKAAPQQSTLDWQIYRLQAFPVADAYRLTSLPAAFVGTVQAADANSAVRAATEQYGLRLRYQRRLDRAPPRRMTERRFPPPWSVDAWT